MRFALAWSVLMLAACAVRSESIDCAIPGERIHWIADYCMAKLETDDEIPASACIDQESKHAPRDACGAKREYKRRLCELAVSRGTMKTDVQSCVADPAFMGRTVRQGGVGG